MDASVPVVISGKIWVNAGSFQTRVPARHGRRKNSDVVNLIRSDIDHFDHVPQRYLRSARDKEIPVIPELEDVLQTLPQVLALLILAVQPEASTWKHLQYDVGWDLASTVANARDPDDTHLWRRGAARRKRQADEQSRKRGRNRRRFGHQYK